MLKQLIALGICVLVTLSAVAQTKPAPVPEKVQAALGKKPGTSDVDERSKLKNYDKSLYERLTLDKKSLYDQLGGKSTIERIVNDGVDNVYADYRIAGLFSQTEAETLKEQLVLQICELAGGPCKYKSRSMERAHEGLNITEADFNALVEDFQAAMRKNGISFELETKILALLAPMKPAIVYR